MEYLVGMFIMTQYVGLNTGTYVCKIGYMIRSITCHISICHSITFHLCHNVNGARVTCIPDLRVGAPSFVEGIWFTVK